MARPKPGESGDQRHLVWGSIRWSIAKQMRLVATMGGVSRQYSAILAGHDVVLTREQVTSFVPEARRPAELAEHAHWTLSGNDTLAPVA